MPNPEMTLTFEWDGETVHKETKHYEGAKDKNGKPLCITQTAFIEEALGGHDMKRRMKDDKRRQRKLLNGLTA